MPIITLNASEIRSLVDKPHHFLCWRVSSFYEEKLGAWGWYAVVNTDACCEYLLVLLSRKFNVSVEEIRREKIYQSLADNFGVLGFINSVGNKLIVEHYCYGVLMDDEDFDSDEPGVNFTPDGIGEDEFVSDMYIVNSDNFSSRFFMLNDLLHSYVHDTDTLTVEISIS